MQDNQSKVLSVPHVDGIAAAEAAAATLGSSGYDLETKELSITHKSSPERVSESPKTQETCTFDPVPFDVALFLHTSGTTAKRKGVPLSHGNLIASINNISTCYKLVPNDSVLLIMPLFHVHRLMSALMSTLATGGTVILPRQVKFLASHFWHNAKTAK